MEHKTNSTGNIFDRASYTYDLAGNRLTQADYDGTSTVNLTFSYDAAHRLTQSLP